MRGKGRHNFPGLPQDVRKSEVSISIPINRFNSCNNNLFTGMALTLHKSQLHCFGVLRLQQTHVAELASALFYCFS